MSVLSSYVYTESTISIHCHLPTYPQTAFISEMVSKGGRGLPTDIVEGQNGIYASTGQCISELLEVGMVPGISVDLWLDEQVIEKKPSRSRGVKG